MSKIFSDDFMVNIYTDNPNNAFFLNSMEATKNATIPEDIVNNGSIFAFLLLNFPDYIPMVPSHWLSQDNPSHYNQIFVSISFLIIGIPANIGHILVFLAFIRLVNDSLHYY